MDSKKSSCGEYKKDVIKVGYTFKVDVVRLIEDNYRKTREPRSKYLARLVREDSYRKMGIYE